jgi:hypothetical protein
MDISPDHGFFDYDFSRLDHPCRGCTSTVLDRV